MEDTQVTPLVRLRPIWIILGAAAVTVCGGLAVCAAVFGLGLNLLLTGDSGRPTQVAFGRGTPTQILSSSATVTLAPTPSQIPLNATLPPPPLPNDTGGSLSGSTFFNTNDPAEAVRAYYQWVDENRYELSWPMLSERFKGEFNCCAPNYNYTGYVDWWDSVDHVVVADAQAVQQRNGQTAVYIELRYLMKSGRQSVDRSYILLVQNPATGSWLIDDKQDTL